MPVNERSEFTGTYGELAEPLVSNMLEKKLNFENASQTPSSLDGIVDYLHSIPEEQRMNVLTDGIELAAESVKQRRPVLFILVDDTVAGGRHFVPQLLIPNDTTLIISKPVGKAPEDHKGQLPTLAHALEVAGRTVTLSQAMPHPQKLFVHFEEFEFHLRRTSDVTTVLIPLILNPERTNAIIFHTQARGIDPEALLLAYDRIIQDQLDADRNSDSKRDWIRHTMLVTPRGTPRPESKSHVLVQVLDGTTRDGFNLIHPGRIAHWDNPNSNKSLAVTFLQ